MTTASLQLEPKLHTLRDFSISESLLMCLSGDYLKKVQEVS